jgi:hypothetical protein
MVSAEGTCTGPFFTQLQAHGGPSPLPYAAFCEELWIVFNFFAPAP